MASGLPFSPLFEPLSRLGTLLKASPDFLLNPARSSRSLGQLINTWETVSCAPHNQKRAWNEEAANQRKTMSRSSE
ncbi:hypothetical protein N7491_002454 [Penicillium cf. griseofulvum]|uniref:Uncharacterized protein n=1 Tax=Penicillium cf. griseofulvum TaxID=2972120 RepID=A0A9W9T342_9EURO|nr:hypothetical protein N7472_003363 [Penicillium cf. griseofulvum]KAJ5446372.1 hypothetical protein N7491_002454 [Penicillium cf. griseofulvum]KAJ5448114.1 hypothetical protein N7445_002935 [Penicillium cf. griseofulvum]